jgi:hypothetical protein
MTPASDNSPPDLVPAIMERVRSLSPEYQQFFLDYVEFLLQKEQPAASETAPENPDQPGA